MDLWCERGDSNPHGLTRQILSLVRLPIPPLSQAVKFYIGIGSASQSFQRKPNRDSARFE